MSSGHPLSPLQEARWRLTRAEPGHPWAVSLTLDLQGALEPAAVRTALERLLERHEVLRTRVLSTEDGRAEMVIEPAPRASLQELDWSASSLVERERECRRLEQALREACPRDGAAPLQAALARVSDASHVLVLAQSTLVADWRSLWNLARELVATLAGEPPRDDPVQFSDLALWLREVLQEEDAHTGLEHWQRLEVAAQAELRLPLEFDRGARPFGTLEVSRELPPLLQDNLTKVAEGRGIPAAALLCAAWQAWLARLAGRGEVVIAVRSAGRAFQGLDEALGTFERGLPVHARLDERVTFAQLARRSDEEMARGAEWHEFFQPAPVGTGGFPFRYAFEHLPRTEVHAQGALRLEILRRDGHGEPFRALLRVEESPLGCELRFAVDPRFLGEGDAAALADAYVALLENALARPDAPLASLPATTPEQHARLLELARGPELVAEPRSVQEWIATGARARPDAPAVVAGEVELSYHALEQRASALAAELRGLGVRAGTFVGVHLERSVELVVALLAVLRAGGAYVPLPPGYPRGRVLDMLDDSRATVVIGSETSAAALTGFRGRIVLAGAPRATPTDLCEHPSSAADPAYVIYTSGSTGRPKGVVVSHANLSHSTRSRVTYYPERVSRYLVLSSFAFDSSVAGIFWTLAQGGTLILPPEGFEKDLTVLPGLIERHAPTHLLALPSLWSLVLELARPGQLDSLETVIVAGESCSLELLRRHAATLPRAHLFNEYGPTEGTVWSTVFDTREPFERAQVPIGRPIPGSANYVLTPERELAPLGLAGELWIGGPGVVCGYHRRPELTAERFADDLFSGGRMYRTGDLARYLPDGNLEFLGRLDHQVKIRGFRVELEEIESVLREHPAVREAVVLAREDEGRGTRLVAYAVPIGPRPAETDLLRYLGQRLPEYMVPVHALCLEALPLLPNGKLDRAALPAPDEEQGFAEPEGALEIVLAALWADVLGLEEVGRNDDFFALGGHSLSATRLYARLKETLQVRMPLRALFEHRTPALLASALRLDPEEGARIEHLATVVLAVLESAEDEQALGA